MAVTDETPFHLTGNYAPVTEEITATDLEVEGQIPEELDGRYLRNGANPITGESEHWFLGDGMVHGVRLRGGKAEWYRNRYVRTPFYDDPTKPVIDLENLDFSSANSKANTHVVGHGGRILCLEEGHVPYELDGDLDTVGPLTFDGKLDDSFTAHPKICPTTGEMIAFGYGVMPPYLTYLRVSGDGELVQQEVIDIPAPVMMHDFNVTQNHVVFMDLPVVFDLDMALQGTMPFSFEPDNGARLGVLPREGSADQIRWHEIDPCYVFHPVNAYEDDALIHLDVARYPSMWAKDASFTESASLWRWTIDTAAGSVSETQLDDRGIEFGRVADANVAHPYRYGYAVSGDGDIQDGLSGTIVKYDMHNDSCAAFDIGGAARQPGEFVFVAREGATAEDDGWVMGYVYDKAEDRSDLMILDAQDPGGPPTAVVKLPRRVPFGFHGSWVAV